MDKWNNKDAQPNESESGTKKLTVFRWRQRHPEGRKIECHRDTGFSRMTIDKWWDEASPINFQEADR